MHYKRYTVGASRARLSDALDEAERGVPVIIERRGTRFHFPWRPYERAEPPRGLRRSRSLNGGRGRAVELASIPEGLRFRARRR